MKTPLVGHGDDEGLVMRMHVRDKLSTLDSSYGKLLGAGREDALRARRSDDDGSKLASATFYHN